MYENPSIVLGDHFDQFICYKLKDGKYSSASEVISNGLRMLEQDRNPRQKRDDVLSLGDKSGTPKVFYSNAFKANMRGKYLL
jgi:antitoxin ParD1/3/4